MSVGRMLGFTKREGVSTVWMGHSDMEFRGLNLIRLTRYEWWENFIPHESSLGVSYYYRETQKRMF